MSKTYDQLQATNDRLEAENIRLIRILFVVSLLLVLSWAAIGALVYFRKPCPSSA